VTRTKSKRKTVRHSRMVKAARRKSSKRLTPVGGAPGATAKSRAGTKNAQILAMLRDRSGTTIAAMVVATGWQEHSVRGFLAGVVRKRLGLNLVSEPGEHGRTYRIVGNADRAKQAA
jgi:Protein of unknown function (DUF3489)